ncbi:hypothetical protein [Halegenticoccus tardaugens]|uniref:hypothetical protein n=1 Tax=Halegenticoccus tardaugens TaxID=2071624 RepID=UPI00100AE49B|nr:hypothetical protein [Halegenticoccus tardaugens]
MESQPPQTPAKGDQYEHDDGSVEVVFESSDGRVLTVREYPTVPAFAQAVDDAAYRGTHHGIADLPDISVFENWRL